MLAKDEKTLEFCISRAGPNDFADFSELYNCSIKCNPRGFVQDLNFHGPIECQCKKYQKADGEMLIGKIDNNLIGMGALQKVSKERIELCKLHIHPEYQGYGYGKKITLELIERAKQLSYKVVELHVTKTQKAAIGLYQSLGFCKVKQAICSVEVGATNLSFDTLYMEKTL